MNPETIYFEYTNKCNLNCSICWLKDSDLTKKAELTTQEIKTFFNSLNREIKQIKLYGGEPLVRKDFFEICRFLKEKGFYVKTITNGTLIYKKIAEKIISLGIDSITLSLDGDKDIHNQIRGNDSFSKTLGAISYINELKSKQNLEKPLLSLNCVINSANYDKLSPLVSIAAKLGILLNFQYLMWLSQETNKEGSGNQNLSNFDIPFREVDAKKLQEEISKIKHLSEKNNIQVKFRQPIDNGTIKNWFTENDLNLKCGFPLFTWIRSNGDLAPCQFIDYTIGNVLKEDFFNMYNSEKANNFREKIKKTPNIVCKRCCNLK